MSGFCEVLSPDFAPSASGVAGAGGLPQPTTTAPSKAVATGVTKEEYRESNLGARARCLAVMTRTLELGKRGFKCATTLDPVFSRNEKYGPATPSLRCRCARPPIDELGPNSSAPRRSF